MNADYLQHYQTLGIEPGCNLRELKAAYRRQVKTWHPDRFHSDSAGKIVADEKIKEVNKAFQVLSGYNKKNGHLPPNTPDPVVFTTGTYATYVQQPGVATAANGSAGAWPRHDGGARLSWLTQSIFFIAIGFIAIGAILGLSYSVWDALHVTSQPGYPMADGKYAISAGQNSVSMISVPDEHIDQTDVFSIGSSLGEVVTAQGVPTTIEEGVWHYGKSKVFFSDGLVSGWHHDLKDPLRTSLTLIEANSTDTKFTLGSSKENVKSAQGMPIMESENLWDYGISKVYFEDGKVTGWYSSPYNPLKLKKNSSKPKKNKMPSAEPNTAPPINSPD